MEKFRDIEAKTFATLTPKIRKIYGDEGVIIFYLEKYNLNFESLKIRYLNGESLKSLSKEFGIGLNQLKQVFNFYGIQLRTQQERMELLNTKLPNIFKEKYGVENPFQLKSSIKKIQEKRNNKKHEIYEKMKNTVKERYGVENVFSSEDVKLKIKKSMTPEKRAQASLKASQTRNSFPDEKKQNIEKRRMQTLEQRYGLGVKNPWQISHIVEKNHSNKVKEKQLKTKIKNGYAVDYEKFKRTEKEQYYFEVNKLTRLAYREFREIINPDNIIFKNREYGIDHIFSKIDGFLGNVSPLIIAHPCNLRILTTSQNSRKNSKSDQTLEELLSSIEVFNKNHSQKNSKFLNLFNEFHI